MLTAADDDFHPPIEGERWFHETSWFWFSVPERGIGSWIYNWVRPNIGVAGGGCWVWDTSTHVHWDAPYFSNHMNLAAPVGADMRDIVFPTGISLKMLEPLTSYAIGYRDEPDIAFDLRFDAVMEPWVSSTVGADGVARPHHLDQFGRVTGTLVLHGESIPVDCHAIRDRTWSLRSERWNRGGGYGYTSAMNDAGDAFLAVGDSSAMKGFVVLDGVISAVTSGTRVVKRDDEHGWPITVELVLRDDMGRETRCVGRSISRICTPVPAVHGVVWTSVVEWTIDGRHAWGDDQEPWPVKMWAAFRRRRG